MLDFSQKNHNFYDDLLLVIALTISIGGFVYFFYALNWLGLIISLTLIIIAFRLTRQYFISPKRIDGRSVPRDRLILAAYGLTYTIATLTLFLNRTDRSLISPWQVVNPNFFYLYILLSLILVWLLTRVSLGKTWKLILFSLHYLLSFSVAAIIYKIGYGFDPFIHQATLELIDAKGAVLPKTPYYAGQYGLIIIIHKLIGLPVAWLNRFLVPGLASLILPTAIFNFLNEPGKQTNDKHGINIFLTTLFLLIFTFSPFIVTTPQNLSYIFLILTILSGLKSDAWPKTIIWAAATAVIHPLTGLPALAWAGLTVIRKYQDKIKGEIKAYLRPAVWLSSALVLPLALFLSSGHSFKTGTEIMTSFSDYLTDLIGNPGTASREDWLTNLIYFFASNYQVAVLFFIIGLIIYYWFRRHKLIEEKRQNFFDIMILNSALVVAYLLSGLINFSNLINYEQADYAKRIPIIIFILFLPLIIPAGEKLIARIGRQGLPTRIIWLGLGLAGLTASLYLSYPRFDKYYNSRGYSTGINDIKAVQLVAEKANRSYIVLANQQVSAAALKKFGFDHYFSTGVGPVYFYPIPTGGPLYQYYLDMVYKSPSRESMTEALRLTGAKDGYLIVNKYWYQSDRVIGEAKLRADKWWTINNEIYIFLYQD